MKIFEFSHSGEALGLGIGAETKADVVESVELYLETLEQYREFATSNTGKQALSALEEIHLKHYPLYWEELKGIAKATNLPFLDIFLLNFRGELKGLTASTIEKGCSTASSSSRSQLRITHNEDGHACFKDKMFLTKVKQKDAPWFVSLNYPGFICGNALGFNENGICYSVNNLTPNDIKVGKGRQFIARSLLEARDIDDACRRVTTSERASGFNYTIASTRENRIVSVEVSPSKYSIKEIQGQFFHANHYTQITNQDQSISLSSSRRQELAEEMTKSHSALEILSNRDDPNYPILRTGKAPDTSATLLQATFDISNKMLQLYDVKNDGELQATLEMPLP